MYSVSEAASRLGLTDRHIRFLLGRGEMSGRKLGHDWVVLKLDYKRKRKPKSTGGSGTGPGGLREKPEEVWTEGSL